jgi:hypothetical protein
MYILGLTFIAKFEAIANPAVKYQPLIALLLPAVFYGIRALSFNAAALLFVIMFALWVAFAVRFIYGEKRIKQAVSFLLAGISLLDAAALAVTGWWFGAVIAVVCFGLTLFFQRYISGT